MSPLLLRRLSDERLGGRLALGEAAAFDELYRRYVHRLAAYAAQLLGDAAAGEDVAQAALLRAYQALRAGQVPGQVRPWLYRIAHNAAIDLVRRRREFPIAELPEQASPERDPAAGVLAAALDGLPARQRRVFVLRELHGLRIDETAAELGLTAAQVEQSLFAARNRIAEQIVFGRRLHCGVVRRLASGPLDGRERRAIKSHLRSCPNCRCELGLRHAALTFLPVPAFGWLRSAAAWVGSAGSPAAAKLGTAVAAATLATGVPIAVGTEHHTASASIPVPGAPDGATDSRFRDPSTVVSWLLAGWGGATSHGGAASPTGRDPGLIRAGERRRLRAGLVRGRHADLGDERRQLEPRRRFRRHERRWPEQRLRHDDQRVGVDVVGRRFERRWRDELGELGHDDDELQ